MKNKLYIMIFAAAFLFVNNASAQYQVTNSTISSGGMMISNAANSLSGTVGEIFMGNTSSANYQNQLGFWNVYQADILTDVAENKGLTPTEFKLEQNYPNPFNPSTTIKFAVPERSSVMVKIYDILGREVITLVNKEMDAGWYQKTFNASGFSSGVYLLRMEAGKYVSTKKMILMK